MAEVIARRAVEGLGWDGVEVRSAGVGALDGDTPSAGAVRAAASHGLDLQGHRATLLSRALATSADLVLVMSPSHLVRVVELGAGQHAALLTTFAEGADGSAGSGLIPDPIGGSDEEYKDTFEVLQTLIEQALQRVEPEVAK
jgi:protein-tyrosine phosphatase